ncbi:MAG: serine hydrolase [Pseudomonadales bacterium]|nr:serine hydrolase [Pseudomonadales bacterium]
MNDIAANQRVFPGTEWALATPESMGIDAGKLARATEEIFTIDKRFGFLVAKHGRIVHEHYLRDASATNKIFSATKGLGATLIGIAQAQGILHVDDLVSDWLPVHHPDIAEGAQIRHLLNMTASKSPAGSWWQYNSAEILNSLTGILWLASGMPPVRFYEKYLRAPLGLSFEWPSNNKGWIQIGSQGPLPVIEATHRDIARMGLLWMRGGQWNDQQLIDPDFLHEALTAPYPEANGAYGYLWWLNAGTGTWRTTGGRTGTGRWFADAPANMFLALGARGKVMVVLPDEDLVAVTMGDTAQEQSANYLDIIVRNVIGLAS